MERSQKKKSTRSCPSTRTEKKARKTTATVRQVSHMNAVHANVAVTMLKAELKSLQDERVALIALKRDRDARQRAEGQAAIAKSGQDQMEGKSSMKPSMH